VISFPLARGTIRRQVGPLLLGVLAISIPLFSILHALVLGLFHKPVFPTGDEAVIEIYTIHASHWSQLLGPYSRFGWNHPGPAYFYLLLPIYELLGRSSAAVSLGAFLINLSVMIGIIVTVQKCMRRECSVLAFYVPLTIYLRFLCRVMTSAWNPDIVILPACALFFTCGALSVGHIGTVPVVVLLASFVSQTQVGCIPTVFAVMCVSVVSCWVYYCRKSRSTADGGDRKGTRRDWLWFVVAAMALMVMWLPPLIEQCSGESGNFAKLYAFFGKAREAHSIQEAFPVVAEQLAAPFAVLCGVSTGSLFAATVVVALIMLFVAGTWAGRKRQRDYCASLCLLAGVGIVVGLWSATRIEGEIFGYLIKWMSCFGVIGLAGALGALLPQFEHASVGSKMSMLRKAGLVVGVLLCCWAAAAGVVNIYRFPRPSITPTHRETVGRMYQALQSYLHENQVADPMVVIDHPVWPFATGMVLQMYKNDLAFSVEDKSLFMYGRQFAGPAMTPSIEIEFSSEPFSVGGATEADRVLIGKDRFENRDVFVYGHDTTYVPRHLYRGPAVTIKDTVKTKGDPNVLVDGKIPADGSVFDNPACLVLLGPEASVTLSVPDAPVLGLVLSADGNDAYSIFGSKDGKTFDPVALCPGRRGFGMRTRAFLVRGLSDLGFIKVLAESGDGFYSIGEIGFLVQQEADRRPGEAEKQVEAR